MTSPPYADQRKHTYGGVTPENYVDWFLSIADELYRVLKPTGSFILNIKESVVKGERLTYVMELIMELKKRGWHWTESYIWHKRNACPGKWPNRFRDAWERCEHFTKQKDFCMYQESVMVPMKDWHKTRLNFLSKNDYTYRKSKTNSGFGVKMTNMIGRKLAYPDNVLYLASETKNQGHSAVFPESLPEWFIKLFTKEGDTILDPFMGSGTTLLVSKRLNRHSIGIDLRADYCTLASRRLGLSAGQDFYRSLGNPINQNLDVSNSNNRKDAKIKSSPKIETSPSYTKAAILRIRPQGRRGNSHEL
jgi:site-specific DNA-methyltransferase (adenine-specific)/site-specific DNA-methyltransferase (cytosine-N4-specific)